MIVCSTQPVYRYSGLSTDTKPTTNVRDASTFWETDTGRRFEWRGSAWCEDTPAPVTIDIPALESIQVSNFPATQPVPGAFQPLYIPLHDKQVVDDSGAPAETVITYSLNNVVVATKTITVAGANTTIAVTYGE